jgi:hypothetical protein
VLSRYECDRVTCMLFGSIDGGRERFGVAADRKAEVLRHCLRVGVGVRHKSHFCVSLVVEGLFFSVGSMVMAMDDLSSYLSVRPVQQIGCTGENGSKGSNSMLKPRLGKRT